MPSSSPNVQSSQSPSVFFFLIKDIGRRDEVVRKVKLVTVLINISWFLSVTFSYITNSIEFETLTMRTYGFGRRVLMNVSKCLVSVDKFDNKVSVPVEPLKRVICCGVTEKPPIPPYSARKQKSILT